MIIFEIPGRPISQQQTRTNRGNFYDPCYQAKQNILWMIRPYAPSAPLTCPIKLDLAFYLIPPKSTSKAKRRQMISGAICHITKPDIDNLAYFITNAMKQVFYHDDSQIVDLYLHKRYGEEEKTVVSITPLEQLTPTKGDNLVCSTS